MAAKTKQCSRRGCSNPRIANPKGWCRDHEDEHLKPCREGRHQWGGWHPAGARDVRFCQRIMCHAIETLDVGVGI